MMNYDELIDTLNGMLKPDHNLTEEEKYAVRFSKITIQYCKVNKIPLDLIVAIFSSEDE